MTVSDHDLKAAIEAELDDLADEAVLRGETVKSGWEPEIDSLAVINICVRIQEETGIIVSEKCVPVGGFPDRKSCVDTMVAHAKAAMAQMHKIKQEAK